MTLNDCRKDKRMKGIIQIVCILIGCLLLLSIFIHPVNAEVNPNSTLQAPTLLITDNSVTWIYNYTVLLTYASLDGVNIENFDLKSKNYTAYDLKSNSPHEFCINSLTERNCEIGYTLLEQHKDNVQDLTGFLFSYIWWIIAASLLVCAVWLKSSMIGFISAISCLIGMVKGIQDSSFIVFMLYLVTFICAYVITENIREG